MAAAQGSVQASHRFEAKVLDGDEWKSRIIFCTVGAAYNGSSKAASVPQLVINKMGKVNRVIKLNEFYGVESGSCINGESRTLTIVCASETVVFAFFNDETSLLLESWLRCFLGFGCSFCCSVLLVPLQCPLRTEEYVRLHLVDERFCLVSGTPGVVVVKLKTASLKSFGAVRNKFCFEAKRNNSRQNGPVDSYILRTTHSQQIDTLMRLASKRQLHGYLLRRAMRRAGAEEPTYVPVVLPSDRSPSPTAIIGPRDSQPRRSLPSRWLTDRIACRLNASMSLGDDQLSLAKKHREALVRKYSDSQLRNRQGKRCHRCLQHKYVNQAFIDSLELYDNCTAAHAVSRDCIHVEDTVQSRSFSRGAAVFANASMMFRKTGLFSKRSKKETTDKRMSQKSPVVIQPQSSNSMNKLHEWLKRSIDPRGRKGSLTDCDVSRNTLDMTSSMLTNHSQSRRSVRTMDLNDLVNDFGALRTTPRRLEAKLINTSEARRQLRTTLHNQIRGSFSCYDGTYGEETAMVMAPVAVNAQRLMTDAPLSAPCMTRQATVFDFSGPASTTTDADAKLKYCEVTAAKGTSPTTKVKSSSLPCHTSRRQSDGVSYNYALIDKAATLAARKTVTQRAEQLTGRWSSMHMLVGNENPTTIHQGKKREQILSSSTMDNLAD